MSSKEACSKPQPSAITWLLPQTKNREAKLTVKVGSSGTALDSSTSSAYATPASRAAAAATVLNFMANRSVAKAQRLQQKDAKKREERDTSGCSLREKRKLGGGEETTREVMPTGQSQRLTRREAKLQVLLVCCCCCLSFLWSRRSKKEKKKKKKKFGKKARGWSLKKVAGKRLRSCWPRP